MAEISISAVIGLLGLYIKMRYEARKLKAQQKIQKKTDATTDARFKKLYNLVYTIGTALFLLILIMPFFILLVLAIML